MFSLKSFFNKSFLVTLIFIVSVFFTGVLFTQASSIVVDDPSGDDIDNGLCSIVEAGQNALLDNQSGSVDCAAGSGDDVISIQTDITLTSAYDVDGSGYGYGVPGNAANNLIINGNNFTISRDSGAGQFRIFFFSGNADITINDLTISGGDVDTGLAQGGAIYATTLSSLILNNVTFDNNTAVEGGAVYVSMDSSPNLNFVINGSTFSNNSSSGDGGVLYIKNPLNTLNTTISDSTFEYNWSGGDGGAIFADNLDSLNISTSYFTRNGASAGGNGLYLNGSTSASVDNSYFYFNVGSFTGGVFYVTADADLSVSSSTLEANHSGYGGVFYLIDGSELTAYNSTFRGNTGGNKGGVIYSHQDSSMSPNLINFYHNTGSSNTAGSDASSTLFNCIFDVDSCISSIDPSPFVGDTQFFENNIMDNCVGNLNNTSFLNNVSGSTCTNTGEVFDPFPSPLNMAPLELRGGLWKTVGLLAGSTAIDAGVAGTLGCPATDGRGVPRPVGAGCDIGAYEYTGEPEVVITESSGSTDISEPSTSDTYTINLGEGADSSVTINLAKSDTDFDISPSSVTFTTLNWYTPQTITVTAVDNSDNDGDRERSISHSVDSSDVTYSALTPNSVVVNISDNESTTSSSGGGPNLVYGCTESLATNYNASANRDNGTCEYPPTIVSGCMDASANNFNSNATESDGSCTYDVVLVYGCTNPQATNYNPNATASNNNCIFPEPVEPIEPVNPVDPPVEPDPPIPPVDVPVIVPIENVPVTTLPENPPTIKDKISLEDILGEASQKVKSLPVAGLVAPLVIFMITQPAVAASIPIRLWSLVPTLFGIRRKRRPWGTVYDSVTKQPLDPVHLSLKDEYGKEVATTITDIDGRFGFLVVPGRYTISANKSDYEFPSKKLSGKIKDELYDNLYFNETIEVKEGEEIIMKNIPMDPIRFNWNEFNKMQNQKLMRFYSQTELFLSHISSVLFYAGVVTSVVLLFTSFSPINLIVFGVYSLVIILRMFGVRPKKPGNVLEKQTGFPLSFAIVRVFSTELDREVSHSVVSKTGKYYNLVQDNNYYVKISKKVGEDEYQDVYTSESLNLKKGYLGKKFKV